MTPFQSLIQQFELAAKLRSMELEALTDKQQKGTASANEQELYKLARNPRFAPFRKGDLQILGTVLAKATTVTPEEKNLLVAVAEGTAADYSQYLEIQEVCKKIQEAHGFE